MLALARYTLKGPYQAAAVVGLLAVLSVLIPLTAPTAVLAYVAASLSLLMSCSLVGLIILTQGSGAGLKAILVSILGMTIVAWTLIDAPEFGLWTALVQWLPIIVLAQTWRSSRSLGVVILLGVAMAALAIGAQHLWWGDFEASLATQLMERMREQSGQLEQSLDEALVERNLQLVRLFVLSLGALAYLLVMLVLLLSRWLQARLAQSSGFGEEFRALRLGKPAAAIGILLLALGFVLPSAWFTGLVFLVVIAFMFQGIAVAHARFGRRRQVRLLLGLFYLLLLIFPQVVALTAVIGMIDNWMVFRRTPAKPTDENLD